MVGLGGSETDRKETETDMPLKDAPPVASSSNWGLLHTLLPCSSIMNPSIEQTIQSPQVPMALKAPPLAVHWGIHSSARES